MVLKTLHGFVGIGGKERVNDSFIWDGRSSDRGSKWWDSGVG